MKQTLLRGGASVAVHRLKHRAPPPPLYRGWGGGLAVQRGSHVVVEQMSSVAGSGSSRAHARPDALEIEALANRRIADEYDAAQARGDVANGRDGPGAGVLNGNAKATAAEIGLSRKDIHEARQIRDAEQAQPGIVRATLDAAHPMLRPIF